MVTKSTAQEVIGWNPTSQEPPGDGRYLCVRVVSITTDRHGLTTIKLLKFWQHWTQAAGWERPLTGWRIGA